MARVIDAERPHACWACDYRCGLNIIARTEEEGIADDCPIIGEIPDKHGRLGDLDALVEHIMNVYCTNCKRSKVMCKACEYGDMIDEIDNAPIVLEATE